jgi:aldose 1-epimerase
VSSLNNYSATKVTVDGFDVLRLKDATGQAEVLIARTVGCNAYRMTVRGRSILRSPPSLDALRQKPVFFGNPLMAPWANRMVPDEFNANGKHYRLNPDLGNFLRDNRGQAMHGLLTGWPDWELVALEADLESARAVCRLEFWRYPDLMAQFPFAHTLVVTHRLKDGVLEVETLLENHATEPMPVALGYHPYFQIHDTPRASWRVHFPAGEETLLTENLLPTGRKRPLQLPDSAALAGLPEMHVLTRLARRADGGAEFWVEGGGERVTMIQGPKFRTCVTYAPPSADFICFEPMAATINALNPLSDGTRHVVADIPPGGTWRESFWIQFSTVHSNPGD